MFRLKTVAVVVLLTASSLLTLRLMGLSQWIQAILVIGVELSLGVVLHELVEGPSRRRRARRRTSHPPLPAASRHRRRPGHPHPAPQRTPERPDAAEAYVPACRLLLPVRDDRPGLVEYAIRECRSHRAELDLLYLRAVAVVPMGPVGELTEADDAEARGVIERARRRAERAGVPFRSLYAASYDVPATILEQAEARGADLVVMAAPARGRAGMVARMLGRDDVRAVLDALPEHVGLLVHA